MNKELYSIVVVAGWISLFFKMVLFGALIALIIANQPEKRTDTVEIQWSTTTTTNER